MRDKFMDRFGWLVGLFLAIWGIQGVNLITNYTLNNWLGLRPRSFVGLDGILFMPLLHGSIGHAAANTVPLVVLGGLLAITAHGAIWPVSGLIVVLGGAGVWLFGSAGIHVGASGLIFGWFGFLVARGLIDSRPIPLLVAVGVALVYGTMVWGVLPGQPGVSWEGHLFGAIAGIVAAFALHNVARR